MSLMSHDHGPAGYSSLEDQGYTTYTEGPSTPSLLLVVMLQVIFNQERGLIPFLLIVLGHSGADCLALPLTPT